MQTTVEYENEDSAYGRVLVWKWTLNFAFEHPLGGGFNSYLVMQYSDDKGKQVVAKAFHNVYMEVLGEHGWVGLGIFVLLIITSIRYLYFVAYRIPNQQQFEWCRDLAKATLTSLFVLMACGCFIGIAFQYPFWYLFGAAVCLKEYVRRVSQLVPIRTRETWIAPPLTAESGNLGRNVS